jgi:hypothetical protein
MWYGSYTYLSLHKRLANKRYALNWKDRKLSKPSKRRNSYPSQTAHFSTPLGWKFIVLSSTLSQKRHTSVYFYSNEYFLNIVIPINVTYCFIDSQLKMFKFFYLYSPYCYRLYLQSIADLFTRFNKPFFLKIRFKGKGYYMYKTKRNTIAPQFGYAHRVYIYAQSHSVKFLSKTKILLFGLSKKEITHSGYNLKRVKPINIFTGRGVRFARQIIYKKTGKVSSYR